jgi:hypothetical protein
MKSMLSSLFIGASFSFSACCLGLLAPSSAYSQSQWLACRDNGDRSTSFYAQVSPYQDGSGSAIVAYPSSLSSVGLQRVYGDSVVVAPTAISFTYRLEEVSARFDVTLNRGDLSYSRKMVVCAQMGGSTYCEGSTVYRGTCAFSESPFSASGYNNKI